MSSKFGIHGHGLAHSLKDGDVDEIRLERAAVSSETASESCSIESDDEPLTQAFDFDDSTDPDADAVEAEIIGPPQKKRRRIDTYTVTEVVSQPAPLNGVLAAVHAPEGGGVETLVPSKPSSLPTASALEGLTYQDMMTYYRKFQDALSVAQGEGVAEVAAIKVSMEKKFIFLSTLDGIMAQCHAIVNETEKRMQDVQANIHNEILKCMDRDSKNVERCQVVRKREKNLRTAIAERQSVIIDSLTKFSKTVGT
ncbi:hypothetical protein TrRE_jg13313 [Triparma retinervis]|uniref:Uncharacterized protein n=1 Tax=Triparma retinervis TaxID=2557542 RepID=A0A9W6ZBF0_9STRA|nr:hypothetical protein TrRE_jg13313 [Triparma retinervis]